MPVTIEELRERLSPKKAKKQAKEAKTGKEARIKREPPPQVCRRCGSTNLLSVTPRRYQLDVKCNSCGLEMVICCRCHRPFEAILAKHDDSTIKICQECRILTEETARKIELMNDKR